MIARRSLLAGAALAPAFLVARRAAATRTVLDTLLAESKLIYVSPLKSDGTPSRCKAEIWFAHVMMDYDVPDEAEVADNEYSLAVKLPHFPLPIGAETNLFVVTPADAWRTQAIGLGLDRAKVWVGDHGVWTDSDEFLQAPNVVTAASIESRVDIQAEVLAAMAGKYADDGWRRWGPRFRDGLESGERVMIRYAVRPV